jgi:hypothetical protein
MVFSAANNRAARNLAIRDMNDWGFAGSNVDIVRVRIEKHLSDAATDAALPMGKHERPMP